MKRRIFLRHGLAAAAAALAPLPLLAASQEDAVAVFLASSFPDMQGQSVPLSTYAGRPLVVNFWATWCAPCVKEMPDLDALSRKYTDMTFVGIGVDSQANIERFLQKVQVSYPLLVAGHGGVQIMKTLGNRKGGLPYTVIFDADSKVARDILGQVDPDDLDAYLASL
ncbi:TlpA disulfide reductase family protein [Achromobacter sp. F4_2707]|uniref:TlpA family protein disulfide reductase n=1 Tax=Achromobacter sp. F4_2707 TaxID=3114286 RepID=UPI0039C65540